MTNGDDWPVPNKEWRKGMIGRYQPRNGGMGQLAGTRHGMVEWDDWPGPGTEWQKRMIGRYQARNGRRG